MNYSEQKRHERLAKARNELRHPEVLNRPDRFFSILLPGANLTLLLMGADHPNRPPRPPAQYDRFPRL